ncbi:MAG: DUF952 domain-containing protein [Alphaproteobacteria bacterium]|nr:DUF952 domain-containing protein [Alphaproteobacteria bacterium]
MLIFKVLRPAEWDELQRDGATSGAPVDLADGFVHFSTAEQLHGTLVKHFSQENDLMLLACDASAMSGDLRWEPSRNDALFPHLYRPLRNEDICWSRKLTRTAAGHETGPLE